MNREIRFRAWSIIGKCMYNWEQMQEYPAHKFSQYFRYNDMYEIMQYTGLKDKNGVEIYEGDIVKADGMYASAILFEEGGFNLDGGDSGLNLLYQLESYGNYKVIGNIYENPELLGE